jgi:hypothetical protein
MTSKQEEIREVVEKFRSECYGEDGSSYFTDRLLELLDSQGVKIETKAFTSPGVVSTIYESLIKDNNG